MLNLSYAQSLLECLPSCNKTNGNTCRLCKTRSSPYKAPLPQTYTNFTTSKTIFRQDITCPALLDFTLDEASVTGLSPCIAKLSSLFTYFTECLRANPGSLAATTGISVDFFSSGYLDVSVPPVCSVNLCIQLTVTAYAVGFPHSEIADSNGSYCLICAYRKLVRPSLPLTAQASTVYA